MSQQGDAKKIKSMPKEMPGLVHLYNFDGKISNDQVKALRDLGFRVHDGMLAVRHLDRDSDEENGGYFYTAGLGTSQAAHEHRMADGAEIIASRHAADSVTDGEDDSISVGSTVTVEEESAANDRINRSLRELCAAGLPPPEAISLPDEVLSNLNVIVERIMSDLSNLFNVRSDSLDEDEQIDLLSARSVTIDHLEIFLRRYGVINDV